MIYAPDKPGRCAARWVPYRWRARDGARWLPIQVWLDLAAVTPVVALFIHHFFP